MNAAIQTQTPTWKPRANPWLIAVVVTLAAFMEILDTTIVNVALPHIAGSLSISSDDATWALTSYLVANGIVLTISGWLGSVFGRKRYFLICIAMFTVCSLLCGVAHSLPQLIVFRLLQGFFGGGLHRTSRRSCSTRSSPKSAPRPLRSPRLQPSWRPCLARCSAAILPITPPGARSSSSTSR